MAGDHSLERILLCLKPSVGPTEADRSVLSERNVCGRGSDPGSLFGLATWGLRPPRNDGTRAPGRAWSLNPWAAGEAAVEAIPL